MAINFTNIFGDYGEVVLAIEELEAMMVTVESRRDSLITQYTSSGVENLIGEVNEVFDGIISALETETQTLINLGISRLTDRETVTEEIPQLTSNSIDDVIVELVREMNEGSVSVQRSIVTLTEGTHSLTNTNPGEIILTKKLSGTIRPGNTFSVNINNAGVDSELSLDDTIKITCIDDGTKGSESFQMTGIEPAQQSPFASNQGGNVGVSTLSPRTGDSLISNFFENFTDNEPDDWTFTGDVGDILEETTIVMVGSSSLKMVAGLGGDVSYNIFSLLEPNNELCFYFYLKREATAAGSLDVDVEINGSSVVNDTVTIDATYDDWTLVQYKFMVPNDIGIDDGTTFLKLTNGATTASIFIDGGALIEFEYHGGFGIVITEGEDKFVRGDLFNLTVATDDGGKFQRSTSRSFGQQWASSGTPTISEPS